MQHARRGGAFLAGPSMFRGARPREGEVAFGGRLHLRFKRSGPAGRGTRSPGSLDARQIGPECSLMHGPMSARAGRFLLWLLNHSALGGKQERADAAFCSADRVTLAGSMIPAWIRS